MSSWWELGEWSGYRGGELATYQIQCPFCFEKGNFSTAFHATKKKPNSSKKLNFDTLKCENCAGYVMVLWSSNEHGFGPDAHHDYRDIGDVGEKLKCLCDIGDVGEKLKCLCDQEKFCQSFTNVPKTQNTQNQMSIENGHKLQFRVGSKKGP
ncbi:MAG: hypothetical protein ABIK98_06590 [Pseudomonadota bacterium]|nr:hypothetical protein [Pseudomonadota bacterium]